MIIMLYRCADHRHLGRLGIDVVADSASPRTPESLAFVQHVL